MATAVTDLTAALDHNRGRKGREWWVAYVLSARNHVAADEWWSRESRRGPMMTPRTVAMTRVTRPRNLRQMFETRGRKHANLQKRRRRRQLDVPLACLFVSTHPCACVPHARMQTCTQLMHTWLLSRTLKKYATMLLVACTRSRVSFASKDPRSINMFTESDGEV